MSPPLNPPQREKSRVPVMAAIVKKMEDNYEATKGKYPEGVQGRREKEGVDIFEEKGLQLLLSGDVFVCEKPIFVVPEGGKMKTAIKNPRGPWESVPITARVIKAQTHLPKKRTPFPQTA
ncbi:hypothetical protein AVEN_65595-1 [Araneus ventricosus]|uniref:Uncharacterized protein n=1 Tax=Araneus ventricosus TaxID=182803 RepID=A0A4Y2M427_ARAVE|nr:hypothetical protein AVEN_65595-1 [Araneus ventricosus]